MILSLEFRRGEEAKNSAISYSSEYSATTIPPTVLPWLLVPTYRMQLKQGLPVMRSRLAEFIRRQATRKEVVEMVRASFVPGAKAKHNHIG